MYGMTNYGKLFSDELTEWLIEEGFMQSQYHMIAGISQSNNSFENIRPRESIAVR